METTTLFAMSVLIIAYVGIGGLIFQQVEQPDPNKEQAVAIEERVAAFNLSQRIEQLLVGVSDAFQVAPTSKPDNVNKTTNSPAKQIKQKMHSMANEIANFVIEQVAERTIQGDLKFNASLTSVITNQTQIIITKASGRSEDWDFYGSIFFAATTITTIGYGHVAPQTDLGKVVTVLYAIFGIPLVAAFLGGLSERIRRMAEHIQDRVPLGESQAPVETRGGRCCFCCIALMRVVLVLLLGTTIFILLPSLLFTEMERQNDWTYIEALYYSFVTLSTIGFGDYIAARTATAGWYRIFLVTWIFFGLAWLSSVIALIQATITTYSAIVVKKAVKHANSSRSLNFGSANNLSNNDKIYTIEGALERRKNSRRNLDNDNDSMASIEELENRLARHYSSLPRHSYDRRYRIGSSNRIQGGYQGSSQGLVSVAAAASNQGDKVTLVGVLPQVVQMAVAANAAVNGQDNCNNIGNEYCHHYRNRQIRRPPQQTQDDDDEEYDDDESSAMLNKRGRRLAQSPHVKSEKRRMKSNSNASKRLNYLSRGEEEAMIDDIVDHADEEAGDFVEIGRGLTIEDQDGPLLTSAQRVHPESAIGSRGGGATGLSPMLMPSYADDKRFRRTKMAIHSSLQAGVAGSKGDFSENVSSLGRLRSAERQSQL